MKTKFYCCLVWLISISALPVAAQTADEIIAHHMDAIGGADLIASLKSMIVEANFEVMGNDAPGKTYILDGVGYRNELDFNGSLIVQAINSTGGWMINPMAGAADAQAIPDEDYKGAKDAMYVGGPLYKYADKGSKAELLGKDKVGDADTYKVKLTTSAGTEYTFWIDASTYNILKMERNLAGQVTTTEYSNFVKEDNGFVDAHTMVITLPQGFSLNATVSKVDFSSQIDPSIFDMPK